jgi:citrate synthase
LEDASSPLPAEGDEKTLDPATLDKNRLFKALER